ncbi:MAG: imidazolonepropionase [Dethiobacter sp.]|jgi:imidazolonepropionase|nr:imidazolonepropionase [Dethiobacter sp.]
MKQSVDLLIKNAAQVLTMAGFSHRPKRGSELEDLAIISGGAVAALEGKIIAVGKTADIESSTQLLPHARVFDAWGKVVMPCFVDPHTHLVFAGSRQAEFELRLKGATYMEIMQAGGGILSTVKATLQASRGGLEEMGRRRLDMFMKQGVGTVEIKSGYALNTEGEIRLLEVIRHLSQTHALDIVPTFMGAHAFPPEYKDRQDDFVRLVIEEMLPRVAEEKLAEFCDVFCEEGVFNIEQSESILESAKKYGLLPKLHADEIVSFGGAELAARVGAVSADHLLKVSLQGMEEMAEAGVIAVLLPGTAFFLMEPFAPAREMIDRGVAVALSTDRNPGSSPTESMQLIITLACLKMKLTPAEALSAATINAAHALRRAGAVGSLEAGKQADILIMDAPDYRYIPYHYGVNLVESVYKRGVKVV